ncbi:glutathione transferase GstA [Lysobacter maris]|uniref:Glutathione transferase GstA n=1 Tax=Marilutibacter maris TaxID=1605891 RepID=A0A508AT52_9GAMM|nr:glutathione transferase GstA [Lysobacter maris]KAB8189701.1 glutathione transferase GstA [Lysobacter maris]
MKLYYAPYSCSLSPLIVANEAGIALELERVDIRQAPHRVGEGEAFAAINPKDYVPALRLDDGRLLTEGLAIVLYLADRAPASGLAPASDSAQRYRLLEWLAFIASELHKSYSPWLFHPELGETAQQAVRAKLAARLALVEQALADGPYLLGERFGVADAYAFTVIGWSKLTGVDLSGFPRLRDYLERIAARPSVREAMRAHGMAVAAAA